MEKIEEKVWLALMRTLIVIVKILPVTLFKMLVAAFRKRPMKFVNCSVSRRWF
jgi:hypothetical protein